jgi:hypothetical protein
MVDWRSPPGGDGRGETVDNPNYSPTLPAYRKNFDAAQSPLAARNMLGLKTITENINGLSVVQGNILYGSAADTIALLAKDTNATRYLSNTGSSNNPAWAHGRDAPGCQRRHGANHYPVAGCQRLQWSGLAAVVFGAS